MRTAARKANNARLWVQGILSSKAVRSTDSTPANGSVRIFRFGLNRIETTTREGLLALSEIHRAARKATV